MYSETPLIGPPLRPDHINEVALLMEFGHKRSGPLRLLLARHCQFASFIALYKLVTGININGGVAYKTKTIPQIL